MDEEKIQQALKATMSPEHRQEAENYLNQVWF